MKCLVVCQPYASLIIEGIKDIENRPWSTKYRGPLAILAGKSIRWIYDLPLSQKSHYESRLNIDSLFKLPFGSIIGIADLHDIRRLSGCRGAI